MNNQVKQYNFHRLNVFDNLSSFLANYFSNFKPASKENSKSMKLELEYQTHNQNKIHLIPF